MKKQFRRFLSILLALSMVLSMAALNSFAASPEVVTQLADKLYLHKNSFYSTNAEGDINENYFEYSPNTAVTPYICYGNDVAGAASMNRVFRLEKEAGNTLIAAVNADYFVTKTGVPLGIEIKDGIIRSSANLEYPEVGFTADGRMAIGRSNLTVSVSDITNGAEIPFLNYNKGLTDAGGVVLFNEYYGETNNAGSDAETLNVRLSVISGEATPNGTITASVTEIFSSTNSEKLNEGEMLLSIYKSSYVDTQEKLSSFSIGDQIQIKFTMDSSWQNITQACGAKEMLVENGSVKTFSDNTRAPRTAIGTKANGAVVVYTCDGRNAGGSKGLTLTELARRMSQLGCTNAVNLDGGASTQAFVIYPGNTAQEQINKDSGSSLRSCGNYICFKNNLPKTGVVAQVYAYDNEFNAIAGASKNLSLSARDTNWHAVDVDVNNIKYTLSDSDLGSVSAGVFNAGLKKMDGVITAKYEGYSVDYKVHVLTEGRELEDFEDYELANTDLSYVHNGYKSLRLGSGEYYSLSESFSSKNPTMISFWAYGDASNVYVDYSNGQSQTAAVIETKSGWNRYILSLEAGTKTIDCIGYLGSGEVYIDQIMVGFGTYIDDEAPEIEMSYSDSYINASIKDDIDDVINASDIKLTYDGQPLEFNYASGSGNLIAIMPDADNNVHHVVLTATDESGNIGRMTMSVDRSEEGIEKEYVFADLGASNWSTQYCEYLYNRDIIKGYLKNDVRTYKPTANMTRQEFAVVITSWYGANLDDYSGLTLNFNDNAKIASWAEPAVKAAVSLGMMSGKSINGKLNFDPEGLITRQEVMVVIGRILERGYSAADLSVYKDAGSVASWAKPYVEVLVGQGIINGSNGKLMPNASITREAVAKIIYEID